MLKIPILLNYEPEKQIGTLTEVDGKLLVEFNFGQKITKENIFEIFGNVGFKTLGYTEENGEFNITKIQILEFSLSE